MAKKDNGNFKELIWQACRAEIAYREHSADTKMSAGAIVQGCLKMCNSTPERLNELRKKIEDPKQHLRGCRSFIRQTMQWFSAGRISSGVPASSVRMSLPSRNDAEWELLNIGNSLYELWALACQNVNLRDPGVFGVVTDRDAWQERLAELKAVRDDLFTRITQEFQPSDTVVSPLRSDGYARVFLKLAPDVSLYPLSNLGERAVNHLLSIDPERWTKGPEAETTVKRYSKTQQVAMS